LILFFPVSGLKGIRRARSNASSRFDACSPPIYSRINAGFYINIS
jgi:hypothetical protein